MSHVVSTMGVIGLVSNITTTTGQATLDGDVGQELTRISLPLVDIEQKVTLEWDLAADIATLDLETGALTGTYTTQVGGGLDSLGAARATAVLIHGLLIRCTAGSVSLDLGAFSLPPLAAGEDLQILSVAGRADLLVDLVIESLEADSAVEIHVRGSE